jgi:FixJ family two-component response regulator
MRYRVAVAIAVIGAHEAQLQRPAITVAMAQIIRGASSKEAARSLGISPRTVDFHRANLLKKLGARNAADLVLKVLGE